MHCDNNLRKQTSFQHRCFKKNIFYRGLPVVPAMFVIFKSGECLKKKTVCKKNQNFTALSATIIFGTFVAFTEDWMCLRQGYMLMAWSPLCCQHQSAARGGFSQKLVSIVASYESEPQICNKIRYNYTRDVKKEFVNQSHASHENNQKAILISFLKVLEREFQKSRGAHTFIAIFDLVTLCVVSNLKRWDLN